MRKKSHILLASYLVKDIQKEQLLQHKKAFVLGSILPDCRPSFITTKHEFFGTFEMVQERMERLSRHHSILKINQRVYARHLGEVIHYIADYFTFPHNNTYTGSLKDHCVYENHLKFGLRNYIRSNQACLDKTDFKEFSNIEELFQFIRVAHMDYLSRERNVEEDCLYIVTVCRQVVQGILELSHMSQEQQALDRLVFA
jgi:hypothetical protein